ncbi:hypothetical protein PCANC_14880 [Puccinia coronata f. sp. avenae]|uniref:Uncharacterized protein n=1 Tax=Puccinia coronata f. sp. avenae TaxID=200324 RepID=A0A2N5UP59_9BASI|nr:hypothetical protein PCANC_14880 [Puccinia coronata f. sp. avenae]
MDSLPLPLGEEAQIRLAIDATEKERDSQAGIRHPKGEKKATSRPAHPHRPHRASRRREFPYGARHCPRNKNRPRRRDHHMPDSRKVVSRSAGIRFEVLNEGGCADKASLATSPGTPEVLWRMGRTFAMLNITHEQKTIESVIPWV